MEIYTGFIIGLLGSFHCIGMCGPIALALPVSSSFRYKFYSGRLLYNIGRALTYGIFGLIFGLLGSRINLFGLQKWASILTGIVILISVFLPSSAKKRLIETSIFSSIAVKLKIYFGKLFKQTSLISLFLIGLLNGFLPCGFVYVGLGGALSTGSAISGMLFMIMFGLGTLPLMFITSIAGNFVNLSVRRKLSKVVPVFAVILALIFILRGMSLGIKYISPDLKPPAAIQSPNDSVICH